MDPDPGPGIQVRRCAPKGVGQLGGHDHVPRLCDIDAVRERRTDEMRVDQGDNPANPRQKFQVLEVQGTIYKGQYRMRLIYFRSGSGCLLMGQEILEYANP